MENLWRFWLLVRLWQDQSVTTERKNTQARKLTVPTAHQTAGQHFSFTVIHFKKKKQGRHHLHSLPSVAICDVWRRCHRQSTDTHWQSAAAQVSSTGEVLIDSRHFTIFKCSSLPIYLLIETDLLVYSIFTIWDLLQPAGCRKAQKLRLVCTRKLLSLVEGCSHKHGCVLPSHASFPVCF